MDNIEAAKGYLGSTFVGYTIPGQCVAFWNQVNFDVFKIKYLIKGASTAIELLSATNTRPDLIEQVLMSSGRKPSIGDAVIFDKTYGGGAGHVTFLEQFTADGFIGIEQNYKPNTVTRQKHTWEHVIGFIHYKEQDMSTVGEVEFNNMYRAFFGPMEVNPPTDGDRKRWIGAETNTVVRAMEADPRHGAWLAYIEDLKKKPVAQKLSVGYYEVTND